MCLGPSFVYDWASEDYVRLSALSKVDYSTSSSPEMEKNKDILLRYAIASRGRLFPSQRYAFFFAFRLRLTPEQIGHNQEVKFKQL